MTDEFVQSLPESWRVCRLDEVATIIDSLHKTPTYSEVGGAMVRVTDVQGGFLELRKALRVTEDIFQEFTRRYAPKRGDIVFSRVGSYGNASYAKTDTRFCLGQNTALISPRVNGRFLHLFLQSEEARRQIEQVVVGSTQKTVSLKSISALQIPMPPPQELEAIAAVLGALDDKIELNRRMNATLEAMARSLFQSWFVDFDPVRAKLDGRQPVGLDPATAALFPEHFEETAHGHIPKGWEVRTIESVCNTVTRGVTPEYQDGSGRFIINQRVNRGSDLDWSSLKELSPGLEVPSNRYAKRWDVLMNCLGEGTLGRTHFFRGESDVYAIDQHMSVCRAESPASGAYIYQVLSGAEGQAKIESLKTGSTGMTMFNISKLRSFELVWPSDKVLSAYFKTVESLWFQIANNDNQSRTLATLRDTLLPKLLSGKMTITTVHSIQ